MPPFIFHIGVDKVHIAGELFAEPKSSRSLGLVLCLVEFGLDNEMLWAPGICKVHKFQIHGLKAVLSTCVTVEMRRAVRESWMSKHKCFVTLYKPMFTFAS